MCVCGYPRKRNTHKKKKHAQKKREDGGVLTFSSNLVPLKCIKCVYCERVTLNNKKSDLWLHTNEREQGVGGYKKKQTEKKKKTKKGGLFG